jgi:hypothetical protein
MHFAYNNKYIGEMIFFIMFILSPTLNGISNAIWMNVIHILVIKHFMESVGQKSSYRTYSIHNAFFFLCANIISLHVLLGCWWPHLLLFKVMNQKNVLTWTPHQPELGRNSIKVMIVKIIHFIDYVKQSNVNINLVT